MKTFASNNGRPPLQIEAAMQAAHQAGRAAVLHALVNGLLATQRLSEAEGLAFFKTVRGALEEEVTNAGGIQSALREAGFEEPVAGRVLGAFREAIELQLRLIETEIPGSSPAP